MHGFKMSLDLSMPSDRPEAAPLCGECSMKHGAKDDCWEGILPAGELPLPAFDKYETGRSLVDEGMDKKPETDLASEKDKDESLIEMLKSGTIKMAKNVKKKGKKNDA